jgi:hypothetical protein
MAYEVEVSDEFKSWYESLSEPEQNSVERVVLILMEAGPALGYPKARASRIRSSATCES